MFRLLDIEASLIILVKAKGEKNWEQKKNYKLSSSVVQIGRAKKCQINLGINEVLVSRIHATMFKYDEKEDYVIQDGQPGNSTLSDPDPAPIPSSLGTKVNNQYLTYTIKDTGEIIESRIAKDIGLNLIANKKLLKDRDEILIVPDNIKLIYLRPTKKRKEDFDSTVF